MNYIESIGKGENFNLNRSIYISRIEIIPRDKDLKNKIHWKYIFKEVNSVGVSHTICYFSKNLLALEEHRKRLVAYYQNQSSQLDRSSEYLGKEIKPSIWQQIQAKEGQKIR